MEQSKNEVKEARDKLAHQLMKIANLRKEREEVGDQLAEANATIRGMEVQLRDNDSRVEEERRQTDKYQGMYQDAVKANEKLLEKFTIMEKERIQLQEEAETSRLENERNKAKASQRHALIGWTFLFLSVVQFHLYAFIGWAFLSLSAVQRYLYAVIGWAFLSLSAVPRHLCAFIGWTFLSLSAVFGGIVCLLNSNMRTLARSVHSVGAARPNPAHFRRYCFDIHVHQHQHGFENNNVFTITVVSNWKDFRECFKMFSTFVAFICCLIVADCPGVAENGAINRALNTRSRTIISCSKMNL